MSIVAMKKLTVIAPIADAERTIRRLMYRKCVEVRVTDTSGCEALERLSGDCRPEAEAKLARIGSALDVIGKYAKRRGRRAVDRAEFRKNGDYDRAWKIVDDVNYSVNRISECKKQIEAQKNLIAAVKPWTQYKVRMDLDSTATSRVLLGTVSVPDFAAFEGAFEGVECFPELVFEDKISKYVSVIYHKSCENDVKSVLNRFGFLPAPVREHCTAEECLANAEKTVGELETEVSGLNEKLISYGADAWYAEVLWDMQKTDCRVLEIREKLAATKSCCVLEGWMPADCEARIEKTLMALDCAFGFEEPDADEEPPVLLKNNAFARSFEWVVGMYSYPKYGTFDPTFIMGIFYCAIFGFMFADVGYGLIMILAGFLAPMIMKIRGTTKDAFHMFGYCGIACVICGVLFGGWFGDAPIALLGLNEHGFFGGVWMNPMKDSLKFLIVSLIVGIVHIVGGMAIRFYILCKEGKVWSAIFDIGSWWLIFAGIGLFVVGPMIGVDKNIGLYTAIAGVAIILLTAGRAEKNIFMKLVKGLLGLYDIINYASDILSYSRILALGLAGSVIGSVINLISSMVGSVPGIGFVVLIVVFLIGHLLNIAINVLGAFVHTSRLQYIEFFGKFYTDGGVKFEPAEPSCKHSDDITPENGEDQTV